jgi:hypothetical protein
MIVAAALGAPVAPHLAAIVLPVQAQQAPTAVSIDNFTFSPQTVTVKAAPPSPGPTRMISRMGSPG